MDCAIELAASNHQTPAVINHKNIFETLNESSHVQVYLVAREYTKQS